jgi:hypothetical protein
MYDAAQRVRIITARPRSLAQIDWSPQNQCYPIGCCPDPVSSNIRPSRPSVIWDVKSGNNASFPRFFGPILRGIGLAFNVKD